MNQHKTVCSICGELKIGKDGKTIHPSRDKETTKYMFQILNGKHKMEHLEKTVSVTRAIRGNEV